MLVVGVGAVLGLTACGGNAASGTGDTTGTYNWGIDAELSGTLSFYGQTISDGVNAYVEQVNAAGGINGHKIVVTSLDDAGNQSRAAANATQLATVNNVDAIFGHTLSANCSAAQPAAERYKIPMACLSVAAASPYLFSMGPDNSRAAAALFSSAKKVTGKASPRAAFVYLNTLTDLTLAKSVKADAGSSGVTVATSQQIDLTATDTSGQVAAVVASAPDVILISHTGPGLVTFLKGVRAAGVTAPLVWVDGSANLGSLAQSTDSGVYALNIWKLVEPASTDSGVQDFIKAVTPKLKSGVSASTLNGGDLVTGYVTAHAFGDALKSCGYPCSGQKLATALEKVEPSVSGLVPSFRYAAGDHYPYKNWYLYHVVGTTTTLVDTLTAAGS
jgi:branched-chain amino acid transport system substrate-binding protein